MCSPLIDIDLAEGFVSSHTLCGVIDGGEICSDSSFRVRSALGAGKGGNLVLLVCVGLN